jgi:membrane protein
MRVLVRLREHIPDLWYERANAFGRFLWQRFVEDRCIETAAVLSYGTLFAAVPLTAAVLGIISAFPLFDRWNETLTTFLFTNFVPNAAQAVEGYLRQFAESATRVTAVGVFVLLFSALLIMKSVEDAFNRIWRVQSARPTGARFMVYWTTLTLGPILAVASIALSSLVLESDWVLDSGLYLLIDPLARLLPLFIEVAAFSLAFGLVPNRPVAWRHAIAGGLLTSVLFELAKGGMGWYVAQVPSYEQIYGAVALLPIFLIWIFLCWVVVLLGASMTASLSAFRFQPASQRLPPRARWLALLRLLSRFDAAQRVGGSFTLQQLRELEPAIEDDTLMDLLDRLTDAGLLHRDEQDSWLLARSADQIQLIEAYRGLDYPLPLGPLPEVGLDDEIGERVRAQAEGDRDALSLRLQVALSTLRPDRPSDSADR